MPLVLSITEKTTRTGHEYNDRTGFSYEYPTKRYKKQVVEGEEFVYYETAKGYIGVGVLGAVRNSADPDNSIVEILSYQPFENVVGIKDQDNTYFEVDPTTGQKGVAWQSGVRRITQSRFEKLLNYADALVDSTPPEPATHAKRPQKYAPSEVTQAVEQHSMAVIMDLLAQRHGADNVTEMPRNNPGFDIRLGDAGNPDGYVEVKGTQSSDPVFFLSEGERAFSERHEAQYTLAVVTDINIQNRTHGQVHWRSGAVRPPVASMEPRQWRCSLT